VAVAVSIDIVNALLACGVVYTTTSLIVYHSIKRPQ